MGRYEPQQRYAEARVMRLTVDVNRRTEAEIVRRLSEEKNKSGFIKRLITEEMERESQRAREAIEKKEEITVRTDDYEVELAEARERYEEGARAEYLTEILPRYVEEYKEQARRHFEEEELPEMVELFEERAYDEWQADDLPELLERFEEEFKEWWDEHQE